MKSLSKNWLTEHHIDFEFKQYMLLAYLNEINKHFDLKELYPPFSELIEHYRNIKDLKTKTENLHNSFKEFATSIDLEQLKLNYSKEIINDEIIEELNRIMEFSIPQFELYLNKGKEIYESIEESLILEPIGLQPIENKSGYVLFRNQLENQWNIYSYQASVLQFLGENMHGIHFNYVSSQTAGIAFTPESIKLKLLKDNKLLPNPAVFLVNLKKQAPFEPTVLPITKRKLLKVIYQTRPRLI